MSGRHINEIIGRNIRDRRRRLGLSTAHVAERAAELGVHMSRDILEPIELGKRPARANEVMVLAAILETSPGKLLTPSLAYERTVRFGDGAAAMSTGRFAQWLFLADDDTPVPSRDEAQTLLGDRCINTEPRTIDELFAYGLSVDQQQSVGAFVTMQRANEMHRTTAAVTFTDPDLRIRITNPAWLEMFGYTPVDVAGGIPVVATLVDRTAIDRLWEAYNPFVLERFVRTPPIERIRKDGSTFWAESALLPSTGLNGSNLGVWSVTLPVPDPEEGRTFSEVDIAEDAVLVTLDQNVEVEEWSAGAESLYGYTRAEALGRSYFEIIGVEHTPRTLGLMRQIVEHGFVRFQSENTDRAGARFPVEVVAVGEWRVSGSLERIRVYVRKCVSPLPETARLVFGRPSPSGPLEV